MYLIPGIGMFELPAAGGGYLFGGGLFDGPVTATGGLFTLVGMGGLVGFRRGLAG